MTVTSPSGIADAYDRWSGHYDRDVNRTRDLAGDVIRNGELHVDCRAVVEIGCGTGRNTTWLAERARDVTAIDFSEGMLREARARVASQHVRFVRHDIQTPWPVADGSADVVLAVRVLEHIERLDAIFAEAARVLGANGRLLLCELHPMRQLLGRRAEYVDPSTGQLEQIGAFLHDVSDYVNGAVAAGFRIVRLGEWRDAGATTSDPPRLLSLHCQREERTARIV